VREQPHSAQNAARIFMQSGRRMFFPPAACIAAQNKLLLIAIATPHCAFGYCLLRSFHVHSEKKILSHHIKWAASIFLPEKRALWNSILGAVTAPIWILRCSIEKSDRGPNWRCYDSPSSELPALNRVFSVERS